MFRLDAPWRAGRYIAMSAEERAAKLEELKAAMKAKEEAHEELLKGLQAQYEESNKVLAGR